jgi:quinohemoprotein ethanol dehydrogenase
MSSISLRSSKSPTGNIGTLGLAWATDIDSPMGLATEPIVVNGIVYLSLPQSKVYAIEAVSGRVRWRFDPKVRLDRMRNSWAARSNRGSLGGSTLAD